MDYYDIIVHIFLKKTREYYKLEDFWGDAKFINYEEIESIKKQKSNFPKEFKGFKFKIYWLHIIIFIFFIGLNLWETT